jgi:hypothetical protein
MKARTLATLLGVCLLPALGIGHCELGDARAFGESCLRVIPPSGPAPRPFARVVSFDTTAGDLLHITRLQLEVTACSASLTRIVDGAAEVFPTNWLETGEARALHDALVEAGALDAESAPEIPTGCYTTEFTTSGEVTAYEPSPLPGAAWSNSFSFGICRYSPETDAIEQLLNAWIAAHFDL